MSFYSCLCQHGIAVVPGSGGTAPYVGSSRPRRIQCRSSFCASFQQLGVVVDIAYHFSLQKLIVKEVFNAVFNILYNPTIGGEAESGLRARLL